MFSLLLFYLVPTVLLSSPIFLSVGKAISSSLFKWRSEKWRKFRNRFYRFFFPLAWPSSSKSPPTIATTSTSICWGTSPSNRSEPRTSSFWIWTCGHFVCLWVVIHSSDCLHGVLESTCLHSQFNYFFVRTVHWSRIVLRFWREGVVKFGQQQRRNWKSVFAYNDAQCGKEKHYSMYKSEFHCKIDVCCTSMASNQVTLFEDEMLCKCVSRTVGVQ